MSGGIPIPPDHFFAPQQPYQYNSYRPASQPQAHNMGNTDDVFAEIVGGAKKASKNKDHGSGETKKSTPVETRYEAFTLQRLTPNVGDAKTWSKVGVLKQPFDSNKIYKEAVAHRQRTGVDASKIYDRLLANQQGLIDRMLAQKQRDERNSNAVWTLFDVYKVKQDVPTGFLRVNRETVKLIVTLRVQDKSKSSLSDKPPGSTANANKFTGEIIDLSIPEKLSKDKKDDKDGKGKDGTTKTGKKNKKSNSDDFLAAFMNAPGDDNTQHEGGHAQQGGWDQQWNQAQANDSWQGYGNGQQQGHAQHNDGLWPESRPDHNSFAQPQQQQYWNNHNAPPHAPMAPMHENPMMPMVGVPEQYMPPTLPIDDRAHLDYSARHYSRSRSRERHRSRDAPRRSSRYRSDSQHHRSASNHRRGYYTPSVNSSVEEDGWWSPAHTHADTQFTPPQSPDPFDEPRLRRHGSKRYAYQRESRTLYPDEKYVVVPVSTRRDRDGPPVAYHTRRRPALAVVHDDFPGTRQRRAITNYAEGFDDADFYPGGRRGEGVDFMIEPVMSGRLNRSKEQRNGARRYSFY